MPCCYAGILKLMRGKKITKVNHTNNQNNKKNNKNNSATNYSKIIKKLDDKEDFDFSGESELSNSDMYQEKSEMSISNDLHFNNE